MPDYNDTTLIRSVDAATFQSVMSVDLYVPRPAYIAEHIVKPIVVFDQRMSPGDIARIERYGLWDDNGITKESYMREDYQTIGTDSRRELQKDLLFLPVKEFTGPGDPNNPGAPASFQIPVRKALVAQKQLWDVGIPAFHQSIGSRNLLDNFLRFKDRVIINELLKSEKYHNPGGFKDGETVDMHNSRFVGQPAPQVNIDDTDQVIRDMMSDNVPPHEAGLMCGLCTPGFLYHLRRDPRYQELTRYPDFYGHHNRMPVDAMHPGVNKMTPPQIPLDYQPWMSGLLGNQAYYNGPMGSTMPTGVVLNGICWFTSNNLPMSEIVQDYNVDNGGGNTSLGLAKHGTRIRTCELGIVFGSNVIGIAVGGNGPEVRISKMDDYERKIIAIWLMYGNWALLEPDFVTVMRSYNN
jgi:hypothetical protein